MIGRRGLYLVAAAAIGGGAYMALSAGPGPKPPPDEPAEVACDSCTARHQNLERLREQTRQQTPQETPAGE